MHIGEMNKKFFEGYEDYEYIIFKIKEDEKTSLILWEGYIDSILENQKGWESGLSFDWCEETGPYESKEENIEVDAKTYLDDLEKLDSNLFSERLFTKNEVFEAYNSIKEFVKYVKDNKYTLLVNVGTNN